MGDAADAVLADLTAEQGELDGLLAALRPADWLRPTPAEGWSVLDSVGHLAFFDEQVSIAARDPEAFRAGLTEVVADFAGFMERGPVRAREVGGPGALGWWRAARADAVAALSAVTPGARLPWYGPDMSVASAATARLMETWAHGQDIVDGLGQQREPTERLRHVALLGHKTLANSFLAHGLPVPTEAVRVELTAPDGSTWVFGPAETAHVVTGPALDFCLLTTQRRHRADLDLTTTPGLADQWMDVAQAFAGPPGSKRQPAER